MRIQGVNWYADDADQADEHGFEGYVVLYFLGADYADFTD